MEYQLVRYNVRMPAPIAKVFKTFALLLGYKMSTFIFACALDGLIQKVGCQEYFDMVVSMSGDLLPETSVDAEKTPGRGEVLSMWSARNGADICFTVKDYINSDMITPNM